MEHPIAEAGGKLKTKKKYDDTILFSMTRNIATRCTGRYQDEQVYMCCLSDLFTPFLVAVPSIVDFSPGLFRQLATCQTAANEFLRQFWTSIYPPPADIPAPTSSATQRSARAAKMAWYLGKTHEKVDALVRAAVLEGVEGNRVVVAMKPLMDAVEHALAFHRARSTAVGSGVSLERSGGVKLV